MKESGTVWLGCIPQHWELSRIGSCFEERKTTVSDTDYEPLSVTKNGVIPQLDSAAKSDNNDARKLIKAGDFVINSRSDRKGSSGLANMDGSTSVIYTVLKPRNMYGPFVHHLLRSEPFQEEFYRWGSGIVADLWSTRYAAMKQIPLPVPPFEEQQSIAEYLDRETAQIDALIEKQKLLVDALEERRNALILKSVTKGLDEDAEFQSLDSLWLSRVPMHWAVGSLKWYARLQTGGTPRGAEAEAEGPYPWLRPDDLNELGNSSTATRFIDQDGASQLNIAQSGATLICCIGGSLGKSGQVIEPAYFNQQITSVTWNMNPRYLYFLISGLKEAIRSLSVGNTLPILNNEKLGGLQIVVPPIDEQELICNFIESKLQKIDGLIQAASDTVNLLKERRQALISAAVTGKIDVWGK